MLRLLLVLIAISALAGCSIIRDPANYQASIDLWHDATTAQIPLLEAEVQRARAAGEVDACMSAADTLVFAKYWAAYQRELDLRAAHLLDKPTVKAPTNVPTPQQLCGEED